jgi:DNA-binding CsgD family transcriptional regulator
LLQTLTPRQIEVLAMLCEGLPNKLIARRLDIASGMVNVYIVNILCALKVSSRLQAVLIARNVGFETKPRQVARGACAYDVGADHGQPSADVRGAHQGGAAKPATARRVDEQTAGRRGLCQNFIEMGTPGLISA